MGPTWDPLGPNFCYDFHISFDNSCSNNSTLYKHESEYKIIDFDKILMDVHMGRSDMGPTWDPLGPNFHYDFHISFNISCSTFVH